MPAELRAMKPGSTSLDVRVACASSDTTAPMCGAMAPVAPPGLRAICAHDCPSWWTAAQARPGRTRTRSLRCCDVCGRRPCGKRSVLARNDVGAKSLGVHAPSFRSHVSMLLGAPGRKMKMQFFAEFWSDTFGATMRACNSRGLTTSAKYDATMPVPAICMKRRREKPGPSDNPLDFSQVGHSIFDFGSRGLDMVLWLPGCWVTRLLGRVIDRSTEKRTIRQS